MLRVPEDLQVVVKPSYLDSYIGIYRHRSQASPKVMYSHIRPIHKHQYQKAGDPYDIDGNHMQCTLKQFIRGPANEDSRYKCQDVRWCCQGLALRSIP